MKHLKTFENIRQFLPQGFRMFLNASHNVSQHFKALSITKFVSYFQCDDIICLSFIIASIYKTKFHNVGKQTLM